MPKATKATDGRLIKLIDGKPIINADKSINLSVRVNDIRAAVSVAPDACAVAIACVRQLDVLSARVYPSRTFLEYETHWVRYSTGADLREQIVALDSGEKFHPGIYMLSKIPPSMVTGKARSKGDESRRGNGKKRNRVKHIHTARGRIHYDQPDATPQLRAIVPISKEK